LLTPNYLKPQFTLFDRASFPDEISFLIICDVQELFALVRELLSSLIVTS